MSQVALAAWRFKSPGSAEIASRTLRQLARESLVVINDAATVEWEAGAERPRTSQLQPITDAGALGDAFWGKLFGLLFFGSLLGTDNNALTRALIDVGIDDGFINRVRDEITPGTSALFVMSSDAVVLKIQDAFALQEVPELILTNLQHRAGLGRIVF
ncbi:putative membrane protein [Promicromonospora sp. AC04]|uniref:DUF1269 domain-containing protein n=1 Tax=Promicromonospora sp. AC04 TaxID=2135723 RepID=UPI000D36A62A|nr:DUF1269 domain-containing protein [Promicromonospora sp. AC04]PUB20308.1 putative membrane protein [Promicromonospora sp. AC04]